MNLLIPGAGSQGLVLKEIAEAIGIFHEIAFLDDDVKNPWGIGSLSDYTKLVEQYPIAMPSFGDSHRREKWVDLLEGAGYIVTTLIHPSASVSPSAVIDSVVETMATVQPFVHVDSAVTVGRNTVISPYTRVPRGTIISA